MANWYYEQDGQQRGPVDSKTLKQLAAKGEIQHTTLVWREGSTKRVKATAVKGLIQTREKQSPPLPTSKMQAGSTVPPPLPKSTGEADSSIESIPNSIGSLQHSRFRVVLAQIPLVREWFSEFGDKAAEAGRLGKLYAQKAQIETVKLPQLYTSLGRHLYETRQAEATHGGRYEELSEVISKREDSRSDKASEPATRLVDKVLKSVSSVKHSGEAAAQEIKITRLFHDLGRDVYRSEQKIAGADDVRQQLTVANDDVKRINGEIGELEAAHSKSFISPKKILVAVAALVVLLGITVIGRTVSTSLGLSGDVSITHTPYTQISMPDLGTPDEIDFTDESSTVSFGLPEGVDSIVSVARIEDVDFLHGHNGEPVGQLIIRSLSMGVHEELTESYAYRESSTGKYVRHGPETTNTYDGRKLYRIYVHGVRKCTSSWNKHGLPEGLEVYRGDHERRQISYTWQDDRDASAPDTIQFFRTELQPTIDEYGNQRGKGLGHGPSIKFYPPRLGPHEGMRWQGRIAQIVMYRNDESVGVITFDFDGTILKETGDVRPNDAFEADVLSEYGFDREPLD